jgi:hypothetical protein
VDEGQHLVNLQLRRVGVGCGYLRWAKQASKEQESDEGQRAPA